MNTVAKRKSVLEVPVELARAGPGADGRGEILRAAALAFMERGYNGTSIDDIADQLHATKGRVYHYYRTKQAIYLDVRRSQLTRLLEALEEAASEPGPADERLRRMISTQIHLVESDRPAMYLALGSRFVDVPIEGKRELRQALEQIEAMRHRLEEMFRSVVDEGVKTGVFRKVNATIVAKTCLSAGQMTVLWLHDVPWSADQVAAEMADHLLTGLKK
jgi:AcrR family transcriptional regulator